MLQPAGRFLESLKLGREDRQLVLEGWWHLEDELGDREMTYMGVRWKLAIKMLFYKADFVCV